MLIISRVSCVCAHTLRTKLNGFDKQQMASKAKNTTALGKFSELHPAHPSSVLCLHLYALKSQAHSWAFLYLPF